MKPHNLPHLLISLILSVTLPACAIVQILQKTLEQTEAIGTTIEKKIGVSPSVSYSNNNGVTEVTVYFEQLTSYKITVLELQNLVRETVAENMDKEPQKLYLTINATQNQK